MKADAQRDGRPPEYWWRPMLNAADQIAKKPSHLAKFRYGTTSLKCMFLYSVAAQETDKHRAKFG